MKEKKKVLFLDTSYLILIPFLLFWLFTIRQAVTGSIGGTFVRHEVPQEYNQLKDMLVADTSFSRTLWVPRQSRFTYFDALHPSVEATPLLGATNAAELRRAFAAPDAEQKFARLGIGRVFVEYDALGELFLNDRKYDDGVREEWLAVLDEVPWLTRVQDGKVAMYETPTHNDLFWTVTREPLMYRQIGPSHYLVTIASQNQNVPLYFSQAFHPGWVATYAGKQVHAVKTEDNLIQFVLPTADGGALDVYFAPQRYVDYGMIISICTFAGSVLGMVLVGRLIGRV